MSHPPLLARSFRLSGFALVLSLVALSVSPDGRSAAGAVGAAPRWIWPVGPTHVLLRPFIAPASTYGPGHRGIDIRVDGAGADVVAPADGVVHFAGTVVDRPVLSLRHPGGLVSSFEPVVSELVEGHPVEAGDFVGTVLGGPGTVGTVLGGPGPDGTALGGIATPGHCQAPCLHFGVRLRGEYLSPLNFLGGIPRSVLLPTRELP